MSITPPDPGPGSDYSSYSSDHDLLIDMRRILIDMRSDMRTMEQRYLGLDTRLTSIERHTSDSPGRYLTSEGPQASAWRTMADEWSWFKGVGKFIWGTVIALSGAILSIIANEIFRTVLIVRSVSTH